MYNILQEEYTYFNKVQLGTLLAVISNLKVYSYFNKNKSNLKSIIIDKRYDILKKEIRSINIEINQDKREVIDKIKYLEFDGEYNELLYDIDKYLYENTPDIVNSGMINNLRAFFESLVKDIGRKVSKKLNEHIPLIEGKSELGNIRVYIKDKFGLSDNDDKFINSFVKILHDEGGHSFVSKKEYFRLSRNICIEISLFLLSKYQKFISSTKNKDSI